MFRSLISSVALSTVCALVLAQPHAVVGRAQSSSRSGRKAPFTGTVNINTASAMDLQALPGIGARPPRSSSEPPEERPVQEGRRADERPWHRRKNFLKLKPQLTVSAAAAKAERTNPTGNYSRSGRGGGGPPVTFIQRPIHGPGKRLTRSWS
jgi:hypothetical protein